MNKLKHLWLNTSPYKGLSLGLIILGIGFISWALFGIWAPYQYSADAAKSHYAFPTVFAQELNKLKPDGLMDIKPDKSLYTDYPSVGDHIGSITIPALDKVLPIIQGTGNKQLKKGVGHFIQSVLPGEADNCVLSAHRDTFFSELGNLKLGDQIIVETTAGIFTYEVSCARIVDKDDKTVIVSTDQAVLTLTTCYPFNYIGSAPYRYIISAVLAD